MGGRENEKELDRDAKIKTYEDKIEKEEGKSSRTGVNKKDAKGRR